MTTTATAQYAALRIDGRYRVIDRITSEYVATCSSKAKATEKAAKLNADAPEVKAAVAQLQEELTANADAIGAALSEPLPGEETPAAKPEADTKAYRIGKVLREYVLAQTVTPATSGVTDHIVSRNVCYDGTATLRLSFGDAAVLAQMAAELEKAATSPWAIMAARSAQKTLRNLFVGATV